MRFMASATPRVVTARARAGRHGPRRAARGGVGAHRRPPGRADGRGGRAAARHSGGADGGQPSRGRSWRRSSESLAEPLHASADRGRRCSRRSSASCATRSRSSSSSWSSAPSRRSPRSERSARCGRCATSAPPTRSCGAAGVAQAVPVGDARDRRRPARRGRQHSSPPTSASWRPTAWQPTSPGSPASHCRPRRGPSRSSPGTPLAERSSVLHAGTAVVAGAGEGVVVALGDDTEIGRLGRLVAQAKEPPTPLQSAMAELARYALIVALTACVLVPLLGVLRGQPAREMLLRRPDARVRDDPRGAADPRDRARRARRPAPGAARRPAAAFARRRGRRRHDRAARRQDRDADREPAGDRATSPATASACWPPPRPRTGRPPRRTRWTARSSRPRVSVTRASASPGTRSIPCVGARARCGAMPTARGWP